MSAVSRTASATTANSARIVGSSTKHCSENSGLSANVFNLALGLL